MALIERGRLVPVNLLDGAASIGAGAGGWVRPELVRDTRIINAPALCVQPEPLDIDLGRRESVDVLALIAHTLPVGARVRVTMAADAAFSQGVRATDWLAILPRVFTSWPGPGRNSLSWGDRNFWRGEPSERELAAYGRNRFVVLDRPLTGRWLRIEFARCGAFALGYVFAGRAWVAPINYSRGYGEGVEFRTLVDAAPSGRPVFETRRAARTYAVPWQSMPADAWDALKDMLMVNGPERPLLLLPSVADPRRQWREMAMVRLAGGAAAELRGYDAWGATLNFTEVVA
jgi:hypothetical protein